jgi:HK97 family phage major capsid protein/HK97 family phage prohead protease
MPQSIEQRVIYQGKEVRASSDGKRLEGYASVFSTPSEPIGYTERIAPGAFTRSLADGDEVLALVEHDPGRVLGRLTAGTLRLKQDKRGLWVSIDIPNTTDGNDVRELVRRGDLSQMSFAFVPHEGGDEWETDQRGGRSRLITSARLYDVSVVSVPAYSETEISVRKKEGNAVEMVETRDKYDEIKRLVEAMRQILDAEESVEMSNEDEEKYDKMEARVEQIQAELAKEERRGRLATTEHQLDQPTLDLRRGSPERAVAGRSEDEQARAFWACMQGTATPEQRAMSVGTDAQGGYAVPTEMERAIVEQLDKPGNIRTLVPVIQARNDTQIPIESAIGAGEWVAELGTITPADMTLAQAEAKAYKSVAAISASVEILSGDAVVDMNAYLGSVLGRRLAQLQETAYCNGDGSGKPTGLFTLPGHGGNFTDAVTSDAVIEFWYKLEAQYRANATWVCNDASISVIRKLKDGNDRYLWLPSERYSDLRDGVAGTIMGTPVAINNYAQGTAANAEFVLADLSLAYRIYDRGPTTMLSDPYTNASTGQVNLYAYRRTDGLAIISEALVRWAA